MRKLLTLTITLFALLITTSCKKELPSNIKSTLTWQNIYCERLNKVDSVIVKLNDNDITNMSKEEVEDLYFEHKSSKDGYDQYSNELDEILKLNPEYSDYDEIKNQIYPNRMEFTEDGFPKISVNVEKLENKLYGIPILSGTPDEIDQRLKDFKF